MTCRISIYVELLHISYNKQAGIYQIKSLIDGKIYIGSSNKLRIRQKIHLRALTKGNHHSIYLQNSWNKYGSDNFIFEILEEIDDDKNLIIVEQTYLDTLKPQFNMSPTAGSSLGQKRRPESIQKMRLSHLGEKHSEERRKTKSLAQGGENHWTKKKSFSEESKKRMSQTHKRKFQEGYKHPSKGKKLTEELVDKMRERNYIPISQYTLDGKFIRIWKGASLAQKELGIFATNILACCKNKVKSAGKFKWKYTNE